jgi:hypothetical protein
MYKTIFLGCINRSGGSLLARLFDGHPNVASYPLEFGFPQNSKLYSIYKGYMGAAPTVIPDFDGSKEVNAYELLSIPAQKPKVGVKWGKEHGDPMGVRQNYLEKAFYDNITTDFDHDEFFRVFDKYRANAKNIAELYDALHRAYFGAWDKGKYIKKAEFIVFHSSSGFYLTNVDKYFADFKGSSFLHLIRDPLGEIGSEKTRLARRYYGSRRFAYPPFPNFLVKSYKHFDLKAHVKKWIVAITRAKLLQEKYGVNSGFIVCKYENLLNYPEKTMKSLCKRTGLKYDPILLQPTIANQPWGGNSHQGKQRGINKNLIHYYPKVLKTKEIEFIKKKTDPIRNYMNESKDTPLDLTKLPKKYLFDYEYQRKYFDDKEKLLLYYAVMVKTPRQMDIRVPDFNAIVACLYSEYVRILHIPRLLKMRLFPGKGKQNYT